MLKFEVKENVSLAPLTTFDVGGRARYFASVSSEAACLEALEFAQRQNVPLFILGGGSNILVSDKGFEGIVIHNVIKGITSCPEGDCFLVRAGAGEDWQEFVDSCVCEKLQGIECLAGIPGTVGASPVQNIGAYGQDVSETIEEVRALEVSSGSSTVFANKSCRFEYRASIFNSVSKGKYLITGVTFKLKRNGKPVINHTELENRLAETADFTPTGIRDSVIAIRAGKGLLIRNGYERYRCAGSFFKNPIVPTDKSLAIEEKIQKLGAGAYFSWPHGPGEVKISAAGLIQSAGFAKGYRKGNVGLSPRHTLIVVAYDNATAKEIIQFAEEVQATVMEKFGVHLKPEVQLIGFSSSF